MWQRARDAAAAVAAAAAAAAPAAAPTSGYTRGRGGRGRGGLKRKPTGQPEGQSTPKRSTRNTEDAQLLLDASMAPAPAKGLLASAAEADIPPEGTPEERDSTSGSPEPMSFNSGISDMNAKLQGKLHAREKSPPLPKNVEEMDEYGCRSYKQKPAGRDRGTNSRFITPQAIVFGNLDIGFRDGFNDSTKGHTHVKRGKYLNTPNSDGFHYDHWCNGYDYDKTTLEDFDQDLVKNHGLHPKYGFFLPNSTNESKPQTPYVMPGKPVVFIAEPSGRISHASRSFQKTVNHNRSEDAPWRSKMSASLLRFCKMNDIDSEEVAVTDYVPTIEDLRERSLGTAILELESRPIVSESATKEEQEMEDAADETSDKEDVRPDLSALTQAAFFIEAQDAPKAVPVPPKPAKYDAVRDLFVSAPEPAAPAPAPPSGLEFLADLCDSTARKAPITDQREERPLPVANPAHFPIQEAQDPISNERETSYMRTDQAPTSNERESYLPATQAPISNERETSHVRNEQAPISNERGSYPPATPALSTLETTRMVRDNRETSPHRSAHKLPHPQQPPYQQTHQYSRDEPAQYMPSRQHSLPRIDTQYPSVHDQPVHQQAPPQSAPEYQPSHYYPQPLQEHGAYAQSREHGGYAPPQEQHGYAPQEHGYAPPHHEYSVPEPREVQTSQGHPYDHSYDHRRMSGYAAEHPSTRPSYWALPAPSGQPQGPPPPTHTQAPPPPQHYLPQPNYSRVPFSYHANAEPLPPLRPPRARNQSIQEEPMIDPALRPAAAAPPTNFGNYYPSAPAPGRPYHHSYSPPEPHPGYQQHRPNERVPTPQQHGYVTSPPPHPGYGPPEISPTFSTMQMGGMSMGQGPQDPSQQGMAPNPAFRHRSSGSFSGQAQAQGQNDNSKYRKLQPAPIPAHRHWPNKPELKTIPYDHKDSAGGSAALPNSGPTMIRGWNVNQHRRRPRSDKRDHNEAVNEREDSR